MKALTPECQTPPVITMNLLEIQTRQTHYSRTEQKEAPQMPNNGKLVAPVNRLLTPLATAPYRYVSTPISIVQNHYQNVPHQMRPTIPTSFALPRIDCSPLHTALCQSPQLLSAHAIITSRKTPSQSDIRLQVVI